MGRSQGRGPGAAVAALYLLVGMCAVSDAGAAEAPQIRSQASEVKLELSRRLVHPGGAVKARIKNDSEETITHGLSFSLQRFEEGRWVRLPEAPRFLPAFGVRPGAAGPWQWIGIPAKAVPGRYRIRKTASFIESSHPRKVALYGYFRVCGGCELPNPPRPKSCPEATEVDYQEPLAELPPLPPSTARDGLGIGPPRLRLVAVGDALNIEKGRFGYELSVDRQTIRHPVILDGFTELELDRVNRQGRAVEAISTGRRELGTVAGPAFNGKPFLVSVPARSGLYRFQAWLRDAQGVAVGRFAKYLRVVRPVTDVRLMVEGSPIRPGSRTSFWIENRGTQGVNPLGRAFAFEVLEGSSWVKAPGNPKAFPKVALKPLSAGEVGGCISFEIPPESRPGLYRFSKEVMLSSGAKKRLIAAFEVSSP